MKEMTWVAQMAAKKVVRLAATMDDLSAAMKADHSVASMVVPMVG